MQEPIIARRLTEKDEQAFFQALHAWTEPGFEFVFQYTDGMSYTELLQYLDRREKGIGLEEGKVPDTLLFGFLGDQIVGRISIRHALNDYLRTIGGHIGYGVLPEFRGRGFAKSMLRQSFPVLQDLGVNRAMLTCDNENDASRKTIETCGGISENIFEYKGGKKRRYWILL